MNEIEYVITFDSKEKRMKNPLESWIINLYSGSGMMMRIER
jgi:hypothetical protein